MNVRVPLSPAQQSIYLQEQLTSCSGSNGGSLSVTFGDAPRAGRLRDALLAVAAEHPALRTIVEVTDGGFRGRILDPADAVEVEESDLSALAGQEIDLVRAWITRSYAQRRWDLEREVPVRYHLLHHGGGRATLAIAVHHICFDGRSKFLFANSLMRALGMRARIGGLGPRPARDSDAPDDPARLLDEAVRYWQELRCADVPPVSLPSLPTPGPAVAASTPEFSLAADSSLSGLAKRAGTTYLGAVLAGLAIQLAAYGNPLPVINVTADITASDDFGLIGLGVGVVPVAVPVSPSAAGEDVIRGAGESLRLLRRFRNVPFSALFRSLGRAPGDFDIFSAVAVTYRRMADSSLTQDSRAQGLEWDFFAPNFGSPYLCGWQFRRAQAGTRGRLDYRTDHIAPATALGLTRHLRDILSLLQADPGLPVGDLIDRTQSAAAEDGRRHPVPPHQEQEKRNNQMTEHPTIQTLIAGVWADILESQEISPDTDFLDLGGNSLAATMIASQLTDKLGVHFRARDIYTCKTVTGLSEEAQLRLIDTARSAASVRDGKQVRADG